MLLLGLIFSLIGCAPSDKKCSVDKDCVAASCCHANDAVNKENAPACSGMICSQECVTNTIDCGQGKISCVKGECRAVMNK